MPRVKQIAKKKVCMKECFISLDAEVQFKELYQEKQFLPDLGFILNDEAPYPLPPTCRDSISILGWERLCDQRIKQDYSIVWEFYANLWPNNVYSVFVREQHVSLSPHATNHLFHLPDYPNDSDNFYSYLMNLDDETCDKLFSEITVPGAQWTTSQQGNEICRLEYLTDEAKVWFYFLRHSLMPTGHTSTLTMERVVLLACIVKCRPINVGKIISEKIRICANRKSGEMFFPARIVKHVSTHLDHNCPDLGSLFYSYKRI